VDRGEQPLLVVRTNPLMNFVLSMRTIYPTSLAVFEDAVENIAVRGIIATNVQRVRYDQMARVFVRHGIISADLVVETRGGATLEVRGASKREAEHASTVIRERIASGQARGAEDPAPLDVPGQIRKLAELRDSGAITEAEFQAKKAELLGRM
jgi:hypothetical protein